MWFIIWLSAVSSATIYFNGRAQELLYPNLVMGIRFAAAGILLLGYQYFFNRKKFKINPKLIYNYVVVILFGFLVPQVIGGIVTNYMPSAETSFINTIEPLIIYAIIYFFYKQRISHKKFFMLVFSVITMLAITIFEAEIEHTLIFSLGGLIATLIALSSGYSWVIVGELGKQKESDIMISGIGAIFCGVASLIACMFLHPPKEIVFTPEAIAYLTASIVLGELIVYRVRTKLSAKYSPIFLSTITFFSPFMFVLNDIYLGHKTVSPYFFLLIIPALVSTFIFYKEEISLLGKK